MKCNDKSILNTMVFEYKNSCIQELKNLMETYHIMLTVEELKLIK
jgi:hypothetical protein